VRAALPPPEDRDVTAGIAFDGLTVTRDGKDLVRDATFSVPAGTIGAILGPSGAGKSTILRAIAGLVAPDRGRIALDGVTVFGPGQSVPAEQRKVGMLFQGFALWSHMTALEHLRFALQGRKTPRGEWDARIREVADALGLGNLLDRRPANLSGGERQRLALARALVTRPAALLLDEPTASVDPTIARDVHAYVEDLNARFGITILLVTHDQDEALSLAQTLLVLDRGVPLQSGPPADVYARPRSLRVARFLGEGVLVPATVRGALAETPLGPIAVAPGTPDASGAVLVRPEAFRIGADGAGIEGVVLRQSFRGPSFRLAIRVGDHEVLANAREPVAAGSRVKLRHEGEAPFFVEGGAS
jgi:iron(III) transport system ATP-binding protein